MIITSVVVIKEMSAGNESVGEMWKETRIFDKGEPILNILKWAFPDIERTGYSCRNVIITIPDHNTTGREG